MFDLDDSIAFPNTDRDKFLCGLVCDLVAAEPGLPSTAYLDSLVVAFGYQRHQRLLTGKDRTAFAALCKAMPTASGTAAQQIPWADLKSVLALRKAIVLDSQVIQRGPELDEVRKSYPASDPSLIALIQKAAAELRDLQSQAQPASPEEAAILHDFEEDRQQMCGVAA